MQASCEARAQERSWHRRGRANGQKRPVDVPADVAGHTRNAEAEADRDIRADCLECIGPDKPQQCWEAEGSQDQADETTE